MIENSSGTPSFRGTPRRESLGDKLVRWSEPLERRLPARGRLWLLLALSYATLLAALAVGCWIRGESFIALMALTWRDL